MAYIADGKPGPAVFSGIYLGLSVLLYVAVTKKREALTIAWLAAYLILLIANLMGVIGVLATRADGALFRVTFYVLNTSKTQELPELWTTNKYLVQCNSFL